ncbi:YfbM family protein [Rubinisphaera margarita]|uniref:YfbM family protein n=1 Tax=Rubinisphaera margarita TaxID=2909586 RepID=UPI001EE8AD4C|nr:YfbM family protein [Rubinisphaera margarita]MCG6157082.1 YfbM family protein [Rubinisphaera margarita]
MSMIYVIQQASEDTIGKLHETPRLIYSFVGGEVPEPRSHGFFARLLGARYHRPVSSAPVTFETVDEICDLDKAWHGLHFLLTGLDWEGDPPAAFLLNWGTEIGNVDLGYGPARSFTPGETGQIHEFLQRTDVTTLRSRFDATTMMDLDIYPSIWDRDPTEDSLGYLLEFFEALRRYVSSAFVRRYGLIVHLG